MIKKNIGPDIIIFLSNIIKTDKIFFNEGIIAQFSEHSDSMSISYGTDPLTIGYWLGRIWCFHEITNSDFNINNKKELISLCAGYLVVSGLRVFIKLLKQKKFNYAFSSAKEIFSVVKKTILKGSALKIFYYVLLTIIHRIKRKEEFSSPE